MEILTICEKFIVFLSGCLRLHYLISSILSVVFGKILGTGGIGVKELNVNNAPTTSTPQAFSTAIAKRLIRVLVIYNKIEDVRIVEGLLGQSDVTRYDVTHVSNFGEATSALASEAYDVALLDYFIGTRLASEVFNAVQGKIKLPVIVLTGSDDLNVETMALEAGAFDFLEKHSLTAPSLFRSLDFAIKRYGIEQRLRKSEEKLRRECEKAEALQFSNTDFLGFVGNEIQTPMNAIIGFSQVMKNDSSEQNISSDYRGYADLINSSGMRVLNLIEDLLDLTRTQTETFDARKRRFKRFRTWAIDQSTADRDTTLERELGLHRQQHLETAHSA